MKRFTISLIFCSALDCVSLIFVYIFTPSIRWTLAWHCFNLAFLYVCILFMALRRLPSTVWPKRCARAVGRLYAIGRVPVRNRWWRLRTLPVRFVRGSFALYMLLRVKPATVTIRRVTCRACGLRRRVTHHVEDQRRWSWPRYQHVIQFHPPTRKLVALCGRCQATWPEEPIYAAEGWLPQQIPQPKGKAEE